MQRHQGLLALVVLVLFLDEVALQRAILLEDALEGFFVSPNFGHEIAQQPLDVGRELRRSEVKFATPHDTSLDTTRLASLGLA